MKIYFYTYICFPRLIIFFRVKEKKSFRVLGFRVSFPVFRDSGIPRFRNFGFPGFRVSVNPGFRTTLTRPVEMEIPGI